MSKLNNVFDKAIDKAMTDPKAAPEAMDKGLRVIFNPRSDRYTYDNQADTNYDKDWKPETKEEKETLSPEGYHRIGDRKEKKEELKGDLSEDEFNELYHEKQISVDSTAIDSIDYDPDTEALKVKFQGNGKEYFYPGVPLELVQAFMKAPSKGEFFMNNIHDQYSMYRGDHSKKDKKQQKGIKKYMKSYMKNNKGKWSK